MAEATQSETVNNHTCAHSPWRSGWQGLDPGGLPRPLPLSYPRRSAASPRPRWPERTAASQDAVRRGVAAKRCSRCGKCTAAPKTVNSIAPERGGARPGRVPRSAGGLGEVLAHPCSRQRHPQAPGGGSNLSVRGRRTVRKTAPGMPALKEGRSNTSCDADDLEGAVPGKASGHRGQLRWGRESRNPGAP